MFYYTFWSEPILYNGAACILTVIIEACWFRVFGYKKKLDLGIIALTNVITNVVLNTFLDLVPDAFDVPWLIILELLVVAAEYLIYRRAFGSSKRLLILTFFANVLSFLIGMIVFEIL